MSSIRSLGEKGQVVIPKNIRDQFNLKPGVHLEFSIDDGKIVISPQYSDSFLEDFCSVVKNKLKKSIKFKDIIEKENEERMSYDLS
ncbi:MAG: AbrB/MazE/SpoVT family DNA-binding domain-containing protein [Methanomicrobiales archaeon]|nr:AbrB/MazE/SpoVT family DNA-binding domain-containing protein [Methanomicrobiales archaeon]